MNTHHHAYLYEGSPALLSELADAARALFGFDTEHDPDVRVQMWEKFGIDESRDLAQQASLRNVGGRALFVLGIAAISHDAQQALLKLFEEPQEGTMFVLLVPYGVLLDTVRSRFVEYPEKLELVGPEQKTISPAEVFLSSPYKKRSDMIAAMLKDEDGARERTRQFINELEAVLYVLPNTPARTDALTDIAHFRSYLSDTSPSLKMILEHFAATLPQV